MEKVKEMLEEWGKNGKEKGRNEMGEVVRKAGKLESLHWPLITKGNQFPLRTVAICGQAW